MLETLHWLPFGLQLGSELFRWPVQSPENLEWAPPHLTHGTFFASSKYNALSCCWTFAHAVPFAWSTPIPNSWHVYSLLNLNVCLFFFFGRQSGILDLVTQSCYMPPGAVIWEVQIIVFMWSYWLSSLFFLLHSSKWTHFCTLLSPQCLEHYEHIVIIGSVINRIT